MNAEYIEFDVRKTKDGKLVVFHDITLKNKFNINAKLSDKTWDELNQLRYKGEKIPLFEDVLKRYAGKVKFDIHLKVSGIEDEVVRYVEDYDLQDVIISATCSKILKKIKEKNPNIKTALLFDTLFLPKILDDIFVSKGFYETLKEALCINADGIYMGFPPDNLFGKIKRKVLKNMVEKAHNFNLEFGLWDKGNGDEKYYRDMVNQGADIVIVNRPDIVYSIIRSL